MYKIDNKRFLDGLFGIPYRKENSNINERS